MLSEKCTEFYSWSGQLRCSYTRCPLLPPTLKSGGACAPPEYMAPAPTVTIRPPISSSLQIRNRSFRFVSPHIRNQLNASFHQYLLISLLHIHLMSVVPVHRHRHHFYCPQNLFFQSRLKTDLSHKYFPPCYRRDSWQHFDTYYVHRFISSLFTTRDRSHGRLSWLSVRFLLHVQYTLSYRIAC